MADEHADHVYLSHIKMACLAIVKYTRGVDHADFLKHNMLQDALIRQIGIIGEATKQLSSQFRDSHAGVPWRGLAGMRDKLVHDYLGVDLDEVWLTSTEDVPVLLDQIDEILSNTPPERQP